MVTTAQSPLTGAVGAFYALVVILFFVPELIDLADIWGGGGSNGVYFADYFMRIGVLGIIATVPDLRRTALISPTKKLALRDGLALVFVAGSSVLIIDQAVSWFIPLPDLPIDRFEWPPITDPLLKWFDLTIGLLLVGITEEVVFRKLFRHLFEHYLRNAVLMVVLSSALFGLVHWSAGVFVVVFAFTGGVALMTLYLSCGVLWPAIALHYVLNFVAFAQLHEQAAYVQ